MDKRKLFTITTCAISVVLLGIFIISLLLNTDSTANNEEIQVLSNKTYVDGEIIQVPCVVKSKAKSTIILEAIPNATQYSESILMFKTIGVTVSVFCEGDLIYKFENRNAQIHKNEFGTKWHTMPFEKEYIGKQMSFQFSKPMGGYTFKLPIIYHTNYQTAITHIATSSILSQLFAALIVIFGLIMLLIGIIFFKKKKDRGQMIYYLCFCFFSTLFIASNTPLYQYLLDAPHLLYKINNFSYSLLNIFSYLYFYTLLRPKHRLMFKIMMLMQMALTLAVLCFITFTSLVVNTSHLLYLLTVPLVILTYYNLIGMIKRKVKHSITYITLSTVIISMIFINMILENYIFFDNTYIFEIMIIFTIVPLTVTIKKQVVKVNESMQNENFFKYLAYKDTLTGIFNRNKFNEDILKNQKLLGAYMVMFDINNLKTVNDTLGHGAGDELIKTTANVISDSFAPIGNSYRLGGDEFAVIIKKQSLELINQAIKTFIKACARENLSVAYAINKFNQATDTCLNDLYVRADKFMYIQKEKMKAEQNESC